MGTNYYLHQKGDLLDRLKGKPEEVLHIGKSSGGWCFSLHVHPELGINSLRDWYRLMRRKSNYIMNEYDERIELRDMMDIITNRSWKRKPFTPDAYCQSENDFLAKNSAEYGPNGLLRHRIGGGCIAHGAGTWDLIKGEFS